MIESTAIQKFRNIRDKCLHLPQSDPKMINSIFSNIKSSGGCPLFQNQQSPFDLTQLVTKLDRFSGQRSLFEWETSYKMEDTKLYTVIRPADLFLGQPKMYTGDLKNLKNYLYELTKALKLPIQENNVRKMIDELVEFEVEIAKILVDGGVTGRLTFWYASDNVISKQPFNEIIKDFDGIDWTEYIKNSYFIPNELKSAILTSNPQILTYGNKINQKLNQLYKKTDPNTISNYLCLKSVEKQAQYIDRTFNEIVTKLKKNEAPLDRTKECFNLLEYKLPFVVDHLYMRETFPPQREQQIDKMAENLRNELTKIIDSKDWISIETKEKALEKLKHTRKFLGGVPDAKNITLLDKRYSPFPFCPSSSLMKNMKLLNSFLKKRELLKTINPLMNTRADALRSSEAEAWHYYDENLIYVTAAETQVPFFNPEQPASINYGSIGFYIGHEFTHGFDTGGSQYDSNGDFKNWWDQKTRDEFKKRAQCFVELYSSHKNSYTGNYIDGEFTLKENIADFGGLKAAFNAYKRYLNGGTERKVDGYEKYSNLQTFFMSFGATFCSSLNIEKQLKREKDEPDTHSPDRERVNVALQNFPEFSHEFKCKEGTPMNSNKCSLW